MGHPVRKKNIFETGHVTYRIRLPSPLNFRPPPLDADDLMHLLDRGVWADAVVVGEGVGQRRIVLRVGQVRPVEDLPHDEGEGVDVRVAERLEVGLPKNESFKSGLLS